MLYTNWLNSVEVRVIAKERDSQSTSDFTRKDNIGSTEHFAQFVTRRQRFVNFWWCLNLNSA